MADMMDNILGHDAWYWTGDIAALNACTHNTLAHTIFYGQKLMYVRMYRSARFFCVSAHDLWQGQKVPLFWQAYSRCILCLNALPYRSEMGQCCVYCNRGCLKLAVKQAPMDFPAGELLCLTHFHAHKKSTIEQQTVLLAEPCISTHTDSAGEEMCILPFALLGHNWTYRLRGELWIT